MTRRSCCSSPLTLVLQTLSFNAATLLLLLVLEVTSLSVTSGRTPDELALHSGETSVPRVSPLTSLTSLTPDVRTTSPPKINDEGDVVDHFNTISQSSLGESSLRRTSSLSLQSEDELLGEFEDDVPNCKYAEEGDTWSSETLHEGYSQNVNIEQMKNETLLSPARDDINDEDGSPHHLSAVSSSLTRVRRQTVRLHGPLWTDTKTLFVELIVIGDYHFSQKHGVNAVSRIMNIVGVTNAIYAPLGVVVVLVDIELWTSGNKVEVHAIKEKTLASMMGYRKTMLERDPKKANDNVALITTQLAKGSGGVASTGGMCDEERSVSVVKDVTEDVGVVGLFLAHEMGHNLNMRHDGDQKGKSFPGIGRCEPHGPDISAIMVPTLSSDHFDPTIRWSDCSQKYLAEKKETMDLDCLRNIPIKTNLRSSCGNGIVEYGEECDCGPPNMCKNSCCNSKTCRMAPRAKCASGACCNTDTCQPHPSGKVCRAALEDCDLPEFCSGTSESCPRDVHKGDGSYCGHYNQGHCYEGKCGSHDGRCRKMWGYRASAADPACYRELIKRNDRVGNCGVDSNKQYIHCDKQSQMCGTIYCDARGENKVILSERINHRVKMEYAGSSVCQYIEGFYTHYPMQDWLSPDGAKCGDRQMCINQKCQPILGTDDSLNCPRKCSGNGVCNSNGNCHCKPGYAPPDCSSAGEGGSYDSGSADDSGGRRRPINPVTMSPNRPRVTTPRHRRPYFTRPPYDRPRVTTPRQRRPWDDKPYYPWTTKKPYYPWTTKKPHDRPSPPDIDDNNRSGSFLKSPGMIALWVILAILMLLILIAVMVFCSWDKIRGWWETSGRGRVSLMAPKAALCVDDCCCTTVSKAVQWMVSSGPLGKIKKSSNAADPDTRRKKKKSGYMVEVEIKRTSQQEISRQAPLLPPRNPTLPPKTMENTIRPKYHQSISVDSGCIIDDPDEAFESPSTNVSMSSLVNAFRNYTSGNSSDSNGAENRRSHLHDRHQKEDVSLRRLVIDPRIGHRNSKNSLPQPYQKPPDTRHSMSADVSMCNKESQNPDVSKLAQNPFMQSNKSASRDRGLPNVHIPTINKNNMTKPSAKKPMIPPQKERTPPLVPPSRATPPRTTPPRSTPPRSTPPRSTPPREAPPLPPVKVVNGAQIKPNKPVNLNNSKATENAKNNKGVILNKNIIAANGKVNGRNQPSGGFKLNRPTQKQDCNLNGKAIPNSETQKKQVNNSSVKAGSKNVKNMAQKFENL